MICMTIVTYLNLGYRSQVWCPYTLLNTIYLCTSPLLLHEVNPRSKWLLTRLQGFYIRSQSTNNSYTISVPRTENWNFNHWYTITPNPWGNNPDTKSFTTNPGSNTPDTTAGPLIMYYTPKKVLPFAFF